MQSKNESWCRITDNGGIAYAPSFLTDDLHAPTDAEYYAAGYAKNAIVPPSPPEGKVVASVRYEARDGQIFAVYDYADKPVEVNVYSKLKLWAALTQMGKWGAFKAWLDGTGYTDAWNLCQYLSTDYEGWEQIVAAAKTALILTDEELAALLAAAEDR